jgi:hypothetical protein
MFMGKKPSIELERTGFYTYFEKGYITKEFMVDFYSLTVYVYHQWRNLYESMDEFQSACESKIVTSMTYYDAKKSPIGAFIYQVIWNEAHRIYSLHKRNVGTDIDSLVEPDLLFKQTSKISPEKDLEIREDILTFARKAYDKGVYVDQEILYKNYITERSTIVSRAFMWWRINGKRDY